MDYLAKHQIAIESCPTSNYQPATVKDLKQHPLPTFLEHGILACLNTDDPAVSNITLAHEYDVAHSVLRLTQPQLTQVQINGVKAAFLSDSEKKQLLTSKG